ncbi:unnamed protein product [Cunninghamella blakesleeana]
MELKLPFIIIMIFLWLKMEKIDGLPIYKEIPPVKQRSQVKCEPFEFPIYKIDSCRLSCQVRFYIGHIHYYEESRLLTSIKPDGTFCTFLESGNAYYATITNNIKLANITRLQYGTCQSGICYSSKMKNNHNNHNNDDNITDGGNSNSSKNNSISISNNNNSSSSSNDNRSGNHYHPSHPSSSINYTMPSKSYTSKKSSHT